MDDPDSKTYPMPALLEGTDDTYVGRLRVDPTVRHGLALWVVADQLRKGAATLLRATLRRLSSRE